MNNNLANVAVDFCSAICQSKSLTPHKRLYNKT